MVRRTRAERAAAEAEVLALPWVDRVGPGIPCEGIRWSKVSIRHIHSMCGEPPEGIPDHAHCSFQAKWHFVALDGDDSFATTGNYCWHHLKQQMAHQEEQERYEQWKAKQQ